MVNFTIKNIPPSIHKKLKRMAKQHHRSINSEILAQLESAVGKKSIEIDPFLREVRRLREKAAVFVSEEDLQKYKRQGRP